jgi:polyhydroxybutyrate depolymerase
MVAAGGTSSQGGTASEGGKPGTGGVAGAGGASGKGGATGSGGASGKGGATGSGGIPDAAAMPADAPLEAPPADAGSVRGDLATPPDATLATCTGAQSVPAAGDTTVTMTLGGRSRKYILHVPSGLVAGTALAVVVDLHGAGGNGSQQKGMSGFSALADKEKFLAVFPDGVDGYWNVDDTCCGTAGKEKIDDVGFIKAIVAKLRTDTCIDSHRIYVTGFSNGGGLAHRMGCDAADVVAAIAPMSTDLRTQPCNAARPISMMEVKGMADSLEPYDGGVVGPDGGQYLAVGAKASQKLWADIDKCTGATTTVDKYCESYTQCADGVEADLCSLPNVDHSPYNNALGFDVAATAWKMFQRQPMR